MTARALAASPLPAVISPQPDGFSFSGLRVFDSIPEYHHGIVALRGAVVVYETDSIGREGFIEEGGFYVVERQYPPACMSYGLWLKEEMEDAKGRAQPWSRLKTSREVIRLYRWPRGNDLWRFLLPSGWSDGPYEGWSMCFGMVGKVVGIYHPGHGGGEP